MRVLLRLFGMRPRLERWETADCSPGVESGPGPRDSRDTYERFVAVEAPGEPAPDGPCRRVADAILRYDIFPPWLVSPVLRRAPVEVGDAVGIHYHILPGLGLFFAARVIERFETRAGDWWRTGFTYRTLSGHPETGEETFSAEKNIIDGRVRVVLRSWSRPGLLLTRLAYPWTRRTQRRASHAALDHLQGIANQGRGSPVLLAEPSSGTE